MSATGELGEILGASLAVAQDTGAGFVPGEPLVTPQGSENNFYPSFSPDGKWILFNRASSGSSYSNPAPESTSSPPTARRC